MLDTLHRPVHIGVTLTTAPASEPVSLEEARTWLRVSDDTNDEVSETITELIAAARQKVEDDTGLALLTQTWTYDLDVMPSSQRIVLPLGPVTSVTSVTSYSTADAASVIATTVYRVDTTSLPARIVLKDGQSWPSGLRPQNAYRVVFVAGFTSSATVPKALIQAMRLLIGQWYEQRENVITGTIAVEVPLAYQALIAPYVLRGAW